MQEHLAWGKLFKKKNWRREKVTKIRGKIKIKIKKGKKEKRKKKNFYFQGA